MHWFDRRNELNPYFVGNYFSNSNCCCVWCHAHLETVNKLNFGQCTDSVKWTFAKNETLMRGRERERVHKKGMQLWIATCFGLSTYWKCDEWHFFCLNKYFDDWVNRMNEWMKIHWKVVITWFEEIKWQTRRFLWERKTIIENKSVFFLDF